MRTFGVIDRAIRRWLRQDGPGLSAAVSFYAIFAMAPLLVFGVVMSSKALGPEKAQASAVAWLSDMVPEDAAKEMVEVVHLKLLAGGGPWGNVFSAAILLWAVSLVFVRLLYGTRIIFDEPLPDFQKMVRRKLYGRCAALGTGLLSAAVISMGFIFSSVALPLFDDLNVGVKGALSIGNAVVLTLGGMLMFWFVPLQRPSRRSVWLAGLFLLLAFLVGRILFQAYIGRSAFATAYGVASSVVVFLIWIYYLSCGYFVGVALCAELSAKLKPQAAEGVAGRPGAEEEEGGA